MAGQTNRGASPGHVESETRRDHERPQRPSVRDGSGPDLVLIATPEYARGMPGVLKNGLDWLVGSTVMSGIAAVVANAAPSSGRGHKLRRYLPDAERRLVDSLGRGHPWHSGASCCTLRARSRLIECPPRQCGVFVPSRPWRQGSRTVCRSRSRLGFRTRCLPSGLAVAWLRGPTSTRPGGGYWGSRPSCINGRPTTLIVGSMTCSTSSSIPPSWWWRGIGCGGIGGHGPQESLRSSPADDCLDASAPWIMRTGRDRPRPASSGAR